VSIDDERVAEIVREVLASGDYRMAGMTPAEYAAEQNRWRATVSGEIVALSSNVTELADVVLGTPRTELEGGGRNPDGITHQVTELARGQSQLIDHQDSWHAHVENGGLPAKITLASFDRNAKILVATIAAVAAILAPFAAVLAGVLAGG
jgi:hypothetical protein